MGGEASASFFSLRWRRLMERSFAFDVRESSSLLEG